MPDIATTHWQQKGGGLLNSYQTGWFRDQSYVRGNMPQLKNLSKIQIKILIMSYQNQDISNAYLLIKLYNFNQVQYGRSLKFSRLQIGMKRYLSSTSAVSRSLTRLRDRGLMVRSQSSGHNQLTAAGKRFVSLLYKKGWFYPTIKRVFVPLFSKILQKTLSPICCNWRL